MSDRIVIDPSTFPVADLYQLMANAVVPRPIALVSTHSPLGVSNLAPFSFFMLGGVNPISLVFCPVRGSDGKKKDTLNNIELTGEYVINLVDRQMAAAMNEASAPIPAGESEWPRTALTFGQSLSVKPAFVAESPLSIEMRLFEVIHHGEGPSAASYVIGEAIRLHVRDDLLVGGQPQRFEPIARLGGADYLDLATMEVFAMERPKA